MRPAFHPPHPDQVQHARALVRDGWKPQASIEPQEILATVSKRDEHQHVDLDTARVMWMMLATVRG